MEQISEFVDERQKSWCVHCGGWIAQLDSNRDHVPSKSLLRKPHPPNLPVIEVCKSCNSSFSRDEEYFVAFLAAVLAGSTDPSAHDASSSAKRILSDSEKLRARIERSKTAYKTMGGETRCVWKPDWDRIRNVVLKNARGHAFFEYGEPMLEKPKHIWAIPLDSLSNAEREEFENVGTVGAWPEVGSRMMTRIMTGQDLAGEWVVVQEGVYRYTVVQEGRLTVKTVLSEYLATEVYWDD